jgi:DNA mismatch repair ATPase MutL
MDDRLDSTKEVTKAGQTVNIAVANKKEDSSTKASSMEVEEGDGDVLVLAETFRREIKLTSLKNLRDAIKAESHPELRELVARHSFVGCINKRLALIQHSTELYTVDLPKLSEELFYQVHNNLFGFQWSLVAWLFASCDVALMYRKCYETSGTLALFVSIRQHLFVSWRSWR